MPRIGAKRGEPLLLPRALQFQKPGGGGARMPERVDAKGAARPHPGFRGIGERAGLPVAGLPVIGRGHAWRVVI